MRHHSKRSRPGPSNTGPCGKPASNGSTVTSNNSDRRKPGVPMTDNPSRDRVVIERTFDAPVEHMWQMWTDPEHFKAWYGPEGASIPIAKMDVRVGGTRLVCMEVQTPNGPMQMWF